MARDRVRELVREAAPEPAHAGGDHNQLD
jgi:hypothetical protein